MVHVGKRTTKVLSLLASLVLVVGLAACGKTKAKPLVPLALDPGVQPLAVTLTEQGTQAYQSGEFLEAKNRFSQAVIAAPLSGQAHYNLALALNALGEAEQARQHFIEAANLAPGDKVIWDSPALRPYGNPESPQVTKEPPRGTTRPGLGGGPRY